MKDDGKGCTYKTNTQNPEMRFGIRVTLEVIGRIDFEIWLGRGLRVKVIGRY